MWSTLVTYITVDNMCREAWWSSFKTTYGTITTPLDNGVFLLKRVCVCEDPGLPTWHCWRGPSHFDPEECPGRRWCAAGPGILPAGCPQLPLAHAAPHFSAAQYLPRSGSSSAQPLTAAPQLGSRRYTHTISAGRWAKKVELLLHAQRHKHILNVLNLQEWIG